jgi:hypothetical protein
VVLQRIANAELQAWNGHRRANEARMGAYHCQVVMRQMKVIITSALMVR